MLQGARAKQPVEILRGLEGLLASLVLSSNIEYVAGDSSLIES
jgi:hypothetical protein